MVERVEKIKPELEICLFTHKKRSAQRKI